MKEITCRAKKWGGSIGIVIPKDIVEKENIKPNEEIKIAIRKIILAKDLWSLGPIFERRSAQEIKNEMRKGW